MSQNYINNSRMSRWDKCRRLSFWTDEFDGTGLKPQGTEPEYLSLGKAAHHGLAIHYSRHYKVDEPSQAVEQWYVEQNVYPDVATEEQDEQAAYAGKLVRAYLDRKSPVDDFTVEKVEDEFVAVLGEVCWACGQEYGEEIGYCLGCQEPIFHLVGRIDLGVLRNGHFTIIDHKTTKSYSEEYQNSFATNFQQLGYLYGYGKAHGVKIEEYGINWLQKAKTVGDPSAELKQCPDCRAGKKKVLTCETCNQTGKVERENKLDPFRRKYFTPTDADINRYLIYANRTLREMEEERILFANEADVAYKMNDRSCAYCPMKSLCWDGADAQKWYNPTSGELDNFKPRAKDYVDLIREEAY
jgi:hypothetical protein